MLKHWTAGIMVLLLVCSALVEAQPARGYAWRVRLTGKFQYEMLEPIAPLARSSNTHSS